MSYFTSRKQRVVGRCKTSGRTVTKGGRNDQYLVLSVSIFFFQNDLVQMLEHLYATYNYIYADGHAVGVCAINKDILCSSVVRVSEFMFTWFVNNFMQAKPSKFQMTTFGLRGRSVALRVK